jgi:hypothetical protein
MRKIIQTTDGPSGFMALADDGTVWRWVAGLWVLVPELPEEFTEQQLLKHTRETVHGIWVNSLSHSHWSKKYGSERKLPSPIGLKTQNELDAWLKDWQAEEDAMRRAYAP